MRPSNPPSANSKQPRIYKEILTNQEPTPEDIEEFAKRIGIDKDKEPHLLYLARQGLQEQLPPNWRPCRDPERDKWFYENKVTLETQWEHPLDSVYRSKVAEARASAMSTNTKPLIKSLPPLRKGGAPNLLIPANENPDPVRMLAPPNRLAPLKPISKIATPLAKESEKAILQPGKKISPPVWLLDEESEAGRSDSKDKSEASTNGIPVSEPKILKPAGKAQSDSGKELARRRQLLQKHMPKHGIGSPWDIQPHQQLLSDEEKGFLASLHQVQKPRPLIRAKGNAKFNLEDELELKFETSSKGSDQNEGTSESSEFLNGDESDETSERSLGKGIPQKPIMMKAFPILKTETKNEGRINKLTPTVVEPKFVGGGDKTIAVNNNKLEEEKETLRRNAEAGLEDFKAKLKEEMESRRVEIRKSMDEDIRRFQLELEENSRKQKEELRESFEQSLKKAKEEQEAQLKTEIQAMTSHQHEEIRKKREELQRSNQEILAQIEAEVGTVDRESLIASKKKELEEEIQKEARMRTEELRESLLIEEKEEVEQLKHSHHTRLQGLRQEFEQQVSKLREENEASLEELRHSFLARKEKLLEELKAEEVNLKNANHQKPHGPTNLSSPGTSPRLERKDRELARTKSKYKLLQEKYASLKEELGKGAERDRLLRERSPFVEEDAENEASSAIDDSFNNTIDSHPPPPLSNDRLSRALGALEVLRDEILDMNQGEEGQGQHQSEFPIRQIHPPPNQDPKSKKSNSVRKKIGQSINVFPSKRITSGRTSNISEHVQNEATPTAHQLEIVREAKAFIKSQKYRLSADEEGRRRYKDTHHQSETTESSGIGSLHPAIPPATVGRDIETILASLRKLDSQMQSLWRMVGQEPIECNGFLTPLIHPTSPAALAQFNIMRDTGALDVLASNAFHPIITNADLRKRYTIASHPNQNTVPAVPGSSVLNNLEFKQASKQPSLPFGEDIQNFEALQERIWKTYGPQDNGAEALKQKTADLRQWLKKF